MDSLFWDSEGVGGYFMSAAGDDSIVLRLKENQDGAEPAANSVAAVNLLRLSSLAEKKDLKEKAAKVTKAFAERLEKVPVALPEMTVALDILEKGFTQVCFVMYYYFVSYGGKYLRIDNITKIAIVGKLVCSLKVQSELAIKECTVYAYQNLIL